MEPSHTNTPTYLHWDEKTIRDFSPQTITELYAKGYVFTRRGRGVMQQTRSCRIDLKKFQFSSENRRILKKTEGITFDKKRLPLAADDYDWSIAKMAKDFYTKKTGEHVFSANKIKELLTETTSNFNTLLSFSTNMTFVGYAIGYQNGDLFHYSYPFYDLSRLESEIPKDIGLGMMLSAIAYAQSIGCAYIYLGSLQRPSDSYKLQFAGFEWFDLESGWQTDTEKVKEILARERSV